jgi:hypothetical protein
MREAHNQHKSDWEVKCQEQQDRRDAAEASAKRRIKNPSYDDVRVALQDMFSTVSAVDELCRLLKNGGRAEAGELLWTCFQDSIYDNERLYDLVSRK